MKGRSMPHDHVVRRLVSFAATVVSAAALSVLFVAPAKADDPAVSNGAGLTLTAPDGTAFTAVPSGDGSFLVDSTVDPDGRIGRGVAASLPGGESLNVSPAAVEAARGDAIPSCVTLSLDEPGIVTQTVRAHNQCPATVNVKFLIAFWPDSECFIIPSGGRASYAFDYGVGRYDGAETC